MACSVAIRTGPRVSRPNRHSLSTRLYMRKLDVYILPSRLTAPSAATAAVHRIPHRLSPVPTAEALWVRFIAVVIDAVIVKPVVWPVSSIFALVIGVAGSNQFRYLHQGKLFEVEVQYNESPSGNGQTKPGNGKGHVERCWLCDQCAVSITLRFDARRGAVMFSSLRSSEDALTTVLSQSNAGPTARIVRVLIRPLDLELTPSTRRRTARGLDTRRREAA